MQGWSPAHIDSMQQSIPLSVLGKSEEVVHSVASELGRKRSATEHRSSMPPLSQSSAEQTPGTQEGGALRLRG